ncbi:hypothetical protein [Amycolatopsis sp. NPDC004378]
MAGTPGRGAAAISAANFPVPHRAQRSIDPPERLRLAAAAQRQAQIADAVRARLAAAWAGQETRAGRVALLHEIHAELVEWRYEQALTFPRLGATVLLDAQRFRTSLRESGPLYTRLGPSGRLRAGAVWDPDARAYIGGRPTPASRIMVAYGQAASRRFTAGDVLVNRIVLPGGRVVTGNRLVRGGAAGQVTAELAAGARARGGAARVETNGNPIYVVTAEPDQCDVLFEAGLGLLADAWNLDVASRVTAWQHARYLLFQGPQVAGGSDVVTRVLLVAAGAMLLPVAPVLEHDVDLRCLVLGQQAVLGEVGGLGWSPSSPGTPGAQAEVQ